MNYAEAMDYIEQVNKTGSIYGLDRVRELERRMGCPSKDLKIIHVTGTNGKGSFCAFLSKILEESGYSVGRFISPTIMDYRERIQKNGEYIAEEQLAVYIEQLKNACDDMVEAGYDHPTIFEIETVMALMFFKDTACDFVLLEVGMGGKGDSTNIIPAPVLSVITSISLDHTAILGNTLEEIAAEKAGIIKGNPALIYAQDSAVMRVVGDVCEQSGSALKIVDWNRVKVREQNMNGQTFNFGQYLNLHIGLLGSYQIQNASAAVAAAEILRELDYEISNQAIYNGLEMAKWPGRFEVVDRNPYIVVDGAHNPAGALQLRESLETFFTEQQKVLIAGIFADKDYDKILEIMSGESDTIILHKPPVPRGLDAHILAKTAKKYYDHVFITQNLEEAVRIAIHQEKDVIVSFGSLSTVKGLYDILSI